MKRSDNAPLEDREECFAVIHPGSYVPIAPNVLVELVLDRIVPASELVSDPDIAFPLVGMEAGGGHVHVGERLVLYRHQTGAIDIARRGESYVLITGTGSGKSLGYFIPIVDYGDGREPVTFARYTGQDSDDRNRIATLSFFLVVECGPFILPHLSVNDRAWQPPIQDNP